jgi:hypothetical protein
MALRLRRNVVVLAADTRGWQHMDGITERERRIDVWWCDDASSRLSLMLAYLMTRTADWDEASVRVIAVTAAEEDASVVRQHLTEMLEDVRIDAEVQAIAAPDEAELIRRSADAGLIFMPMKFRANRLVTAFGPPVQSVANGCPVMALVTAAEDVELAPDPDEGEPAEMAAAADRAEHAEQRARKAEEQAITAADLAEKLVTQAAERSTKADADDDAWEQAREAQHEAERLRRRAAKLRAKALIAAGEAESASEPAPIKPASVADAQSPVSAEQPHGNGGVAEEANVQKSKN